MSVNTVAGEIPQLLYSNGQLASRDLVFLDFLGLCSRRRVGIASSNRLTRGAMLRKNWSSLSIRAVLDLERIGTGSKSFSNDIKPQVANLEDIISERGACGVGFIVNLENKAYHAILKNALTALGCIEHRGGCGADNDSSDGSGVMTSIPWNLFNDWVAKSGIATFDKLYTGVGMIFFPQDEELMKEAKTAIVNIFKEEGLEVLGWRPVPVDASVVGFYARKTAPTIEHVFVRIVKEENVDNIMSSYWMLILVVLLLEFM